MKPNRPVTDFFAAARPVVSVEFFPPKNEAGGAQILETAGALREHLHPDFVSITYGAGGSTRERTLKYAQVLKDDYGFQVMPHLTCVGSSRDELAQIIGGYQAAGFCNLMALRGDPPQGASSFQPHPDGLRYASDLVAFIRERFSGFCLGVAGYPETHPEAPGAEADLAHLKLKVDAGASFVTTQLFYDNRHYFEFVGRCRATGIAAPIVAGLMPVLSLPQARRFCAMCGTSIPAELEGRLEAAGDDPEAVRRAGVEWTHRQVVELLAGGAPGIHLYVLNRSGSALELVERLVAGGVLAPRGH